MGFDALCVQIADTPQNQQNMTIKSPLGRVARSGRTTEARRPIIPDTIRLPDGREYSIKDLLQPRGRAEVYNLRGRNPHRPTNRPGTAKYSFQERIWMADATIDQIQMRYSVNEAYARQLKNQGRLLKQAHHMK